MCRRVREGYAEGSSLGQQSRIGVGERIHDVPGGGHEIGNVEGVFWLASTLGVVEGDVVSSIIMAIVVVAVGGLFCDLCVCCGCGVCVFLGSYLCAREKHSPFLMWIELLFT